MKYKEIIKTKEQPNQIEELLEFDRDYLKQRENDKSSKENINKQIQEYEQKIQELKQKLVDNWSKD